VRKIAPALFERIAKYEQDFGKTIHQGKTVVQLADRGTPYPLCDDERLVNLAMHWEYPLDQIKTDAWELPAGAYRQCGGPS